MHARQEEKELHSKNRKAIDLFKQAQEFDHVGNLFQSLDLLKQALAKDDSFDEAVLLAHQVLVKRGEIEEALELYSNHESKVEKEFRNRMLADEAYFFFSSGEYERAKKLKDKVDGKVRDVDDALFDLVKASIEYAIEAKMTPRELEFEQLPGPLNAHPQQYFPSITASNLLIYTVREQQGRGDENLYQSQLSELGWSKPKSISERINTERNEGTASISADGNSLVFTACNTPDGIGSCDLYVSYREGNDWSIPKNLGRAVNTIHWESQPSLSQDGRELYFVSTRPNGLGGQDLWKSTKINGQWTEAINLGENINTRFDDCSPYLHPGGADLFFASRGRLGFGGYDLYRSELSSEGAWLTPLNLGYPINNHRNQVGYTISIDGWAYYSNNEFDGSSELFRFKLPPDLVPKYIVEYKRGRVLSASDSTPVFSEIFVADIKKDSILSRTYSDQSDGRFNLVLPGLDSINLYAKRRGYLLYKEKVPTLWPLGPEVPVIYLTPIAVGSKVVLNDILFELNSAELDAKATKELNIVVEFLRDNPELVVEIGGHTDSSGDEEYNMQLSTERAKAVFNYLQGKNIPKENLVYRGYGETKPLTENQGSGENKKNRRIELYIIKYN